MVTISRDESKLFLYLSLINVLYVLIEKNPNKIDNTSMNDDEQLIFSSRQSEKV